MRFLWYIAIYISIYVLDCNIGRVSFKVSNMLSLKFWVKSQKWYFLSFVECPDCGTGVSGKWKIYSYWKRFQYKDCLFRFRDSHHKDKMIVVFYHRNPYANKMEYWYWDYKIASRIYTQMNLGDHLLTWIYFNPSMNIIKCGMRSLIRSETSKMQPLKFGNG